MITTDDIIAQAVRIISEPVDISDLGDDSDPEEVESIVYARERERIDKFLSDRSDRLVMLRRIRAAAQRAQEDYTAEAKRWQVRAKRRARLAEYCGELAMNVLAAERQLAGGAPRTPYRIELADGSKVGIRVSQSVLAPDVSALPDAFVRVERSPNKVAIATALKAGQEVPGALLATDEHVDWGR